MVRFSDLGVKYATGTYTKQEGVKIKALVFENDFCIVKSKDGNIMYEPKGDDGKW